MVIPSWAWEGWVRPAGRSRAGRGEPASRAGNWALFCLRKQEPECLQTEPGEVWRLVGRLVSQVWVKIGGNRTRAN